MPDIRHPASFTQGAIFSTLLGKAALAARLTAGRGVVAADLLYFRERARRTKSARLFRPEIPLTGAPPSPLVEACRRHAAASPWPIVCIGNFVVPVGPVVGRALHLDDI